MELTFSLDNLPSAAKTFIDAIGGHRVFAFVGDMGAGKTTFISEVCRLLGADDDSGSPTFSIVNEYLDKSGKPIYHFDFYRLEYPEEALDIGVEDYFYSGHLCLIEWPDRIGSLLPEEAVTVNISENPDGTRSIIF
ncbi:MAG: tRNA (adenosine(37)-N6)-threonylcarbamoyltransferase complex ATPase subunit type 1 TsaE [Muribaculaceae bacterium]|jgi:tRNA threonylcarbamoyladenosine biosynthesis protein TsaE